MYLKVTVHFQVWLLILNSFSIFYLNNIFICGIVTDTPILQQNTLNTTNFVVIGYIKTVRIEATTGMRKVVHSKFLCIILILSLLVLGISCEEICKDSSFSHVSDLSGSTLQASSHVADTHIFYDKGSIRFIEEFVLMRQSACPSTVLRISQCIIYALLLLSVFLLYLFFKNSYLCTDTHQNQYNCRTLNYIHNNDGKKSHIS